MSIDPHRKTKVIICVVAGRKDINASMESFDLTDIGTKMYAIPTYYEAVKCSNYDAAHVVDKFREAYVQAGECVACVFIVGESKPSYINPDIKTVSNGKQWMILVDFLRASGVHVPSMKVNTEILNNVAA